MKPRETLLALAGSATLSLLLAACDGSAPAPRWEPPCAPDVVARTVQPAPYYAVVGGFDISSSVPVEVRREAQAMAAEIMPHMVRPGAGAAIRIHFIGLNSYHLKNAALSVDVPVIHVPAYPPLPEKPVNFIDARARKKYQQQWEAWCSTAAAENQRMDEELEDARGLVNERSPHYEALTCRMRGGPTSLDSSSG